MSATKRLKEGGVLLGLIVAILVVGVISAAMVKGLKSQAVTSVRAYNVMRARYAAEAGYTYFSSLPKTEQIAFVDMGTFNFSMLNGDRFTVNVTTNSAYRGYLLTRILGEMVSGTEVVAARPFNVRIPLGGSGVDEIPDIGTESEPDDIFDVADTEAVEEPPPPNNKAKQFPHVMTFGGGGNWKNTYLDLLALHQGFIGETLPTRYSESEKLRTDLDIRYAELDNVGDNHVIWNVALPLTYKDEAIQARVANGGYLAYETQAKISWQLDSRQWQRVLGAQGIAFKLHGSNDAGYEFYAVTLMRYENEYEEDNLAGAGFVSSGGVELVDYADLDSELTGTVSSDGYWGDWDCIPNAIKPAGQRRKYMLVLWKQWIDLAGEVQRSWLVAQDLTSDDPLGIDKKGMIDATIHLRVTEGIDSTGEFVDLKMFVGDSLIDAGYVNNATPNNRNEYRREYPNAVSTEGSPESFPAWPTLNLDEWSSAVDYYTITKETVSPQPVINNSSLAGYLDDGETIRMYDATFLSKNQPEGEQLGDVGLIFVGNFLSGIETDFINSNNGQPSAALDKVDIPSLYMAVDDFAIRWLLTDAGNETTPRDIITDF